MRQLAGHKGLLDLAGELQFALQPLALGHFLLEPIVLHSQGCLVRDSCDDLQSPLAGAAWRAGFLYQHHTEHIALHRERDTQQRVGLSLRGPHEIGDEVRRDQVIPPRVGNQAIAFADGIEEGEVTRRVAPGQECRFRVTRDPVGLCWPEDRLVIIP